MNAHPARYALSCVHLRGSKGRVEATDGRQVFAQDGFSFTLAPGGSACFSGSAPGGAQALLGSGQTSVPMPFRLDTLGPC